MLTKDQQRLLRRLVEGSVLGGEQGQSKEFYALYTSREMYISFPESRDQFPCSRSDFDTLLYSKFVQAASYGDGVYQVTNQGLKHYATMSDAGALDELFETTVSIIQQRFPEEYRVPIELVESAAKKLLAAQDEHSLTEIGHMCRDAIQEFARTFYSIHCPVDDQRDLAKSKNLMRVEYVLGLWKRELGDTRVELLTALYSYYKQVSDLLQKVEHGSEQGKRQLTWDDARLAVLGTYLVMSELTRAERLRRT